MWPTEQLQAYLDDGRADTFVNELLFEHSFDTLDTHIQRKRAVAEHGRYVILFLMYQYEELSRKRLSTETGRTSNKLEQPLGKLLEADLVERIPGPPDGDKRQTYYRITTTGRQEIEHDIRTIMGGDAATDWFSSLEDPAVGGDQDGERIPTYDTVDLADSGELHRQRSRLRDQSRGVANARGG